MFRKRTSIVVYGRMNSCILPLLAQSSLEYVLGRLVYSCIKGKTTPFTWNPWVHFLQRPVPELLCQILPLQVHYTSYPNWIQLYVEKNHGAEMFLATSCACRANSA